MNIPLTKAELEDALQTRSQRWAKSRWKDCYIPKSLIFSPVMRKLTRTAWRVYMIFLTKRRMKKAQSKPGKHSGKGQHYIANNGEIIFTYKEAGELGISRGAFRDSLDLLVRLGLIDIALSGMGVKKDVSLYAISERWKLYGTPQFIKIKRQKRKSGQGFKKDNTLSKGRAKRKSQVQGLTLVKCKD